MRTIQVSTDVFQAIWTDRREPEATEDQILRRKYGLKIGAVASKETARPQGFHDARYGFSCEEGFEIFRVHLGTDYRARAEGGAWTLLNSGARYHSLKELSDATVGHENAWTGWWYLDESGRRHRIAEMRDPSRIRRRRPQIVARDEDL
jgi:hypothetical protein